MFSKNNEKRKETKPSIRSRTNVKSVVTSLFLTRHYSIKEPPKNTWSCLELEKTRWTSTTRGLFVAVSIAFVFIYGKWNHLLSLYFGHRLCTHFFYKINNTNLMKTNPNKVIASEISDGKNNVWNYIMCWRPSIGGGNAKHESDRNSRHWCRIEIEVIHSKVRTAFAERIEIDRLHFMNIPNEKRVCVLFIWKCLCFTEWFE